MSINHGTMIVRDQLRCLIDPANPKCLTQNSDIAIDLSGNLNHGILRNQNGTQTALSSMAGVLEYDTSEVSVPCLNFVGYGASSQGYIEFDNHPCRVDTEYTVESFFKIVSETPASAYNVIFYSSTTTSIQEFGLMAQHSIADPDIAIEVDNSYSSGSSNVRAAVGWHHFVLTFDGTTSRLYLDGNIVYARNDSNTALQDGGWNWVGVGQWANGSYGGQYGYTQGKMGYLSLYGKALSSSEVTQNFNALRGRYGI